MDKHVDEMASKAHSLREVKATFVRLVWFIISDIAHWELTAVKR